MLCYVTNKKRIFARYLTNKQEINMDKFSYAIGLGIGQNLMSMGARDINVDDFSKAIKDVLTQSPTAITHTEARDIVNKYFEEMETKINARNIEQGKVFLTENAKKENIHTKVRCHYEGTLLDGTLFDSSYKRGEPAVFGLNQVIPGWTEALQLMAEGAKYRIFLPHELAYGAQGAGEMIPPYSALIFTVELLEVLK